jgi:hypothetical protein
VGFRKKAKEPDKHWKRPETREATLLMIDATFALNNWSEDDRARNAALLGLEAKPLAGYSDVELAKILDDLVFYKMILLEEKTTSEN